MTTLALLFGLAFIAIGLWARHMALRSGNWPHVEGVVVDSRVDDSNLEMSAPKVRYRYVVDGKVWMGWRVSYSGYGTSRRAMQARIADYPTGQTVKVFYDPADPARSVLSNRPSADWLFWVAAGCIALAGAGLLALQ